MADDEDRLKKEEERLLRAMTVGARKPFKAASSVSNASPKSPATSTPSSVGNSSAVTRSPSKGNVPVSAAMPSASQRSPTLVRSGSKVLTDEEIRAREAEMERERDRLRSVEKNLVKNSFNALSNDGVSENDAIVGDMYRSPSGGAISSPTKHPVAPNLDTTPIAHTTSSTSMVAKASAPISPPPTDSQANKKPLDDIESLLAQLDVAASSRPKLTFDASQKKSPADSARSLLNASKQSVGSLLSASMARDPPSHQTLDDDMATYIRSIVGQVKPVQERGARIASSQFEFDNFARDVDQLVRTVLKDLHFFLQQSDREQLAAHCDELLIRSLAVVDAAASIASGAPQAAAEIAAKQNGFVAALQKLIESLTAAAKRQIEISASIRDAAHNLAECVQETAVYAQQIAEQLKQPLLEIQAFKQSLTSMISAIKKAQQFVDSEGTKEAIMAHTRRVLEASLKLQSGDAEAATAHVDVLHEVTALLKTLMGLLKK